jgi:hypothetical protein
LNIFLKKKLFIKHVRVACACPLVLKKGNWNQNLYSILYSPRWDVKAKQYYLWIVKTLPVTHAWYLGSNGGKILGSTATSNSNKLGKCIREAIYSYYAQKSIPIACLYYFSFFSAGYPTILIGHIFLVSPTCYLCFLI